MGTADSRAELLMGARGRAGVRGEIKAASHVVLWELRSASAPAPTARAYGQARQRPQLQERRHPRLLPPRQPAALSLMPNKTALEAGRGSLARIAVNKQPDHSDPVASSCIFFSLASSAAPQKRKLKLVVAGGGKGPGHTMRRRRRRRGKRGRAASWQPPLLFCSNQPSFKSPRHKRSA